jgi:hypothetical protein
MSKRFPIPEFDRDKYKNLDWSAPAYLSKQEQDRLLARAAAGESGAFGCHAVEAPEAFYDRFKLTGPHRHVVLCALPHREVRMVGRSWAWPIQRAIVVDSLDAGTAKVLCDWTTPRPMNTRLGPENGVTLPGGPVYVAFGNRHSDHWIGNRTMPDPTIAPGAHCVGVISASDEDANDFHACTLAFSWS